jgi:hypothetical protein
MDALMSLIFFFLFKKADDCLALLSAKELSQRETPVKPNNHPSIHFSP